MTPIVEIYDGICVGKMYGSADGEHRYEVTQKEFDELEIPCRAEIVDGGVVFGAVVDFSEVPDRSTPLGDNVEPEPDPEPTAEEKIAALEAQVAEQQKLINILAGGA